MKNVHLLSYFLLGRPPWYNLQGQLKEPFVIGKVVAVVNFMLQKFLQPHPHTLVFDKSMRKKLAKFYIKIVDIGVNKWTKYMYLNFNLKGSQAYKNA